MSCVRPNRADGITLADRSEALAAPGELPIQIDQQAAEQAFDPISALAAGQA
jgi:hypothetical protein